MKTGRCFSKILSVINIAFEWMALGVENVAHEDIGSWSYATGWFRKKCAQ
jgi:hypothetical protein